MNHRDRPRFSHHLLGGSLTRFTELRLGTGNAAADHLAIEGWGPQPFPFKEPMDRGPQPVRRLFLFALVDLD